MLALHWSGLNGEKKLPDQPAPFAPDRDMRAPHPAADNHVEPQHDAAGDDCKDGGLSCIGLVRIVKNNPEYSRGSIQEGGNVLQARRSFPLAEAAPSKAALSLTHSSSSKVVCD